MKNVVADGLLKKIGNALVIGTLYILREVLPQLSTLSNTFQTGNLNFSRAGPNTEKKKKKMELLVSSDTPFKKLLLDVKARLLLYDNQLTEAQKKLFTV